VAVTKDRFFWEKESRLQMIDVLYSYLENVVNIQQQKASSLPALLCFFTEVSDNF
jgi:hypothetical protein